MDTNRIALALKNIENNTAALKWLEAYGSALTPQDRDSFSVHVRIARASALPGAKEAETILSSLARFGIEELVATSIRNCRNTIDIERDAIEIQVRRSALTEEPR